jgi:hypothetical protein
VDAWRTPKLVLRAHLPDHRAQSCFDTRAPSPRVRFPTPIVTKAGSMPPHQRFRPDNRNHRQDQRKPEMELNEEPAVVVGSLSSTPSPPLQDDQLTSEHRILRLKPALRLERRGQHCQNKTEQPDHSTSLGDSITSSTRIRFSVHAREESPDAYDQAVLMFLGKHCAIKAWIFGEADMSRPAATFENNPCGTRI